MPMPPRPGGVAIAAIVGGGKSLRAVIARDFTASRTLR
jgi:hypothetical protein